MIAAGVAAGIVYAIISVVGLVAAVALWRVVIHDKAVTRIRLGVFYERERDDTDDDDEPEHETRSNDV